jgi:hypothetical protein
MLIRYYDDLDDLPIRAAVLLNETKSSMLPINAWLKATRERVNVPCTGIRQVKEGEDSIIDTTVNERMKYSLETPCIHGFGRVNTTSTEQYLEWWKHMLAIARVASQVPSAC